ncbi:MAG: hypothetical protein ACJAVG_001269 [Rickettsiales bacterium]|jgi:hypothetical protein
MVFGAQYTKTQNQIFAQAFAAIDIDNIVKISGFKSAQKAEYFYNKLPKKYLKDVKKAPTNSYRSSSNPSEYYLKISLKNQPSSKNICSLVTNKGLKCSAFEKPNFNIKEQPKNPRSFKFVGKYKYSLESKIIPTGF